MITFKEFYDAKIALDEKNWIQKAVNPAHKGFLHPYNEVYLYTTA